MSGGRMFFSVLKPSALRILLQFCLTPAKAQPTTRSDPLGVQHRRKDRWCEILALKVRGRVDTPTWLRHSKAALGRSDHALCFLRGSVRTLVGKASLSTTSYPHLLTSL